MTSPSKEKETSEDALWRSVKAGTRPLGAKKRAIKATASKPTPSKKSEVPPKAPPKKAAPSRSPGNETARGVGHDRRSAAKLKRGQLAIDATLDLHGMTQAEAHKTLNATLPRLYRQGRRTVLVITGKGATKEGGGVLRKNVPRWLQEAPLAAIVLDHAKARIRDGGEGALYVRLRRERPKK